MAISTTEIEKRIRERLSADVVEVADESALHVGHPGARGGGGHYRARIVTDAFCGRTPIERHRLVYQTISDWMGSEIHAISLTVLTPEEARGGG